MKDSNSGACKPCLICGLALAAWGVSCTGQLLHIDCHEGRINDCLTSGACMQAVECKEGLPIEGDNSSLANINYQSFFGMYAKLAGMTVRPHAQAHLCMPMPVVRSTVRGHVSFAW